MRNGLIALSASPDLTRAPMKREPQQPIRCRAARPVHTKHQARPTTTAALSTLPSCGAHIKPSRLPLPFLSSADAGRACILHVHPFTESASFPNVHLRKSDFRKRLLPNSKSLLQQIYTSTLHRIEASHPPSTDAGQLPSHLRAGRHVRAESKLWLLKSWWKKCSFIKSLTSPSLP